MALPSSKTRVVATIGPASDSPATLAAMLRAGMNVARLNFSHGDFATHRRMIEALRTASRDTGIPLAIMADLSGPKIRIGNFEQPPELRRGDRFTLTTDDVAGSAARVSVSFEKLPQVLRAGDTVYLDDGSIQMRVVSVAGSEIACEVLVGGLLRSRKGLNVPDVDLGIAAFTDRDRECLEFALAAGVDAVSQSFVESAADIHAVREAARALGHEPFVIAKIERSRALARLDEILEAADGLMVARGDLGVEVPIEGIALVQKDIVRRARRRAKPVITATQMLESMTSHRLPTRAEATDVANAILDGTDAVMLSAESATGSFPVESVAMLAKIAAAVEPARSRTTVRQMFDGENLEGRLRPEHLVALAVEACFEMSSPSVVFSPTSSGDSARRVSLLRLPAWIVAVTPRTQTARSLLFSYGVLPVEREKDIEDWNDWARRFCREQGLTGALALLTAGPSARHPQANHRLELLPLGAAAPS